MTRCRCAPAARRTFTRPARTNATFRASSTPCHCNPTLTATGLSALAGDHNVTRLPDHARKVTFGLAGRLACESERVTSAPRARESRPGRRPGRLERTRLSSEGRGLLGRRGYVCRREEPPRDESGFRAHGSNQRFHRLQRHAVARAQTTAPSLAGVSPAATKDSHSSWVAAQGPPGTLSQITGRTTSRDVWAVRGLRQFYDRP